MAVSVLIVEDDRNIAELLQMYLEKEGYAVTVAADGGQGLAKFRAIKPDLVLLDVMMPVMDGWSVCKAIRAEAQTPIIMLTAKGDTDSKVMGLKTGADDYITKPFEMKEVLARIEAVLRRTSGVAAAIAENPVYDLTGAISGFADCTGHYLPLACTINGSRILDAGRAALGVDYDELAKLAFASKPGANGITLVPYFDGERTPNRPDATASLTGLTLHNTTKENLARAFVEGLLCSQRDCLELIRSLGAEINRILLIGGGAKSVAIRTLAPSILGMDVTRPAIDEYVAIGAARQAAWVLSGETEPPAWQLTIDGVETGEPTEAVYEAYAKARG